MNIGYNFISEVTLVLGNIYTISLRFSLSYYLIVQLYKCLILIVRREDKIKLVWFYNNYCAFIFSDYLKDIIFCDKYNLANQSN